MYYSKLIAAVVGIVVLIAAKYGLDLTGSEAMITDAIIAVVTAVGVWLAKNKPVTDKQVQKQAEIVSEAQADLDSRNQLP